MIRRIRLTVAAVAVAAGLVLLLLGSAGGRAVGLALLAAGGLLLLLGRGSRNASPTETPLEEQTPLEMWRSMDEGRDPTQT